MEGAAQPGVGIVLLGTRGDVMPVLSLCMGMEAGLEDLQKLC